jgi:tetratricopeptide (TPR) repeat protein
MSISSVFPSLLSLTLFVRTTFTHEPNLFVGESPWLIVGTYRDDEMPGLPEQLPGMQVMRLERLDETAMREMSAAVLGEAGRQQAIIDLLKRETEGNALFVVEVVRALAEEAGTLGAISLMNLPERVTAGGIQHILRRRIGRVPDWAQPTLKLAAVAGRQLDLQILDKTNASVDWEAWLAACMGVAVLEISDGRWQFTHDKLRETALSDLDPQERQVLHRTIAEAIETAYPDDKSQAAILTEHWHQAGNPAKELHYARLAIEQMIAVSAFRQAATMAERTLPLTTNDLSARAALLNLLGNAQAGLSNYEQAAAYHEESLSLSRQIDDKKAHMTALMYLGDINRLQGQFAEAQSYYNQSLTLAREIGDQRIAAKSLNGLGNITRYQGDYQLALRYNEESLAIKQEIGDRGEIANGLLNLAAIYWDQGDHGRAKSYFEQCLDIFRQVGDRQGAALCLYNLGNVAYSTEDNEAAKAYFEQSKMIFHEIGDQYGLAYSLGGLGNVADEQGDYLAAHSAYEEGLLIFRSIGDQWGVAIHLNNLGNTSRKSGDAGKARRYWRDALQVLGEIEGTPLILDVLGGYAHLYLQENNPHKCAELVGLIDQHPAVADQTRQNHTIPLKADLEAVLSESEREAAFQRGRGFDLQTVVVELMNA